MDITPIIDAVASAAAEHIKAEEGDYLVDGLLYCGKCRTPKQTRITMFGRTITPMCVCSCRAARIAKDDEERKRLEFLESIKRMRSVGFPDKEMRNWTFANDDRKDPMLTKLCVKYAENFSEIKKSGKGLVLYGGVGTGKTFMSACIANALIDKGHPCLMTNFARIVNTLQSSFEGRQEYLDSLNNYDLLVLDDLASERNTEYMNETIMQVIDGRYKAKLPLIVTTNLSGSELARSENIMRQRIYSRLYEMCIFVKAEGGDRRKKMIRGPEALDEIIGSTGI